MPNTIRHNRYQSDPHETNGRYVHRNGPNDFTAYLDGWRQNTRLCRTYSQAARYLFDQRGYGGYPLAYYCEDDGELTGDILCADCAAQEWIADPTITFAVQAEEERLESDCICDNCSTIIAPQQCRLCFDSIHDEPGHDEYAPLPIFVGDYYVAHGHCIAYAMTKKPGPYDDPKPVKVGKQAYRVPGADNQIMLGPHAQREETERAIERHNARHERPHPVFNREYVNAFTDEPYMKGER